MKNLFKRTWFCKKNKKDSTSSSGGEHRCKNVLSMMNYRRKSRSLNMKSDSDLQPCTAIKFRSNTCSGIREISAKQMEHSISEIEDTKLDSDDPLDMKKHQSSFFLLNRIFRSGKSTTNEIENFHTKEPCHLLREQMEKRKYYYKSQIDLLNDSEIPLLFPVTYDCYERVHFLRTKNNRRDAIDIIDKESYIEYLTDFVRLVELGQ